MCIAELNGAETWVVVVAGWFVRVWDEPWGPFAAKFRNARRSWEDFCVKTWFISVTKIAPLRRRRRRGEEGEIPLENGIKKHIIIELHLTNITLKYSLKKITDYRTVTICFKLCMAWFAFRCLYLFPPSQSCYQQGYMNKTPNVLLW